MDKHICGSCGSKKCPDAGNKKYDGMLGPVIDCLKYKSILWSLDWFINWSLVFGLIAGAICIIYAIAT